jgi:hypothetical protein
MIFDNHRPLLQYSERDPAEEQWCYDAADQPTRNQYLSTLYLELQFAQKPDDPHQRDSNKYLENAKEYQNKKSTQKTQQETQRDFKKTYISAAHTLTR